MFILIGDVIDKMMKLGLFFVMFCGISGINDVIDNVKGKKFDLKIIWKLRSMDGF